LTDFPARCLTEAVHYDPAVLEAVRQVYVRHTDPPLPNLEASYARAVAKGWETYDIASGHDVMIAAPGRLTELLVDLTTR
jgi:hypothetical protein